MHAGDESESPDDPRMPLVVSRTVFHGRIPGGSLPLGPMTVLMVKTSKMPAWASDDHDQGVVDIDFPDEYGRVEEINALLASGDARQVAAKYVHATGGAANQIFDHVSSSSDGEE